AGFGGELDDEALQGSGRAGASASSSGRAVVLVRDELAVPTQDRIGGHQAAELIQHAATERFALRCEPAALGVGDGQAPAAGLLPQNAVRLLEKLDDLELAAVHPARKYEQQELERRDRHLRRSYRAEIPVRPAPRGERRAAKRDLSDGFTRSCA